MLGFVVLVGIGAALLEGADVLGVVRAVLLAQLGNASVFTATKHLRKPHGAEWFPGPGE